MRALVFSGGGLFGAWQAGAWSALAPRFQPELIVGASVGSLNGFAVACGATPERLCGMWREERLAKISNLEANLRELADGRQPRMPYALVMTDLFRMRPRIVRSPEVTWRHLAASCALPFLLPQARIDGRLYSDGGLLNPLPVYAAVELGATEILAVNALPRIPSAWLGLLARAFGAMFGVHPPLPSGVALNTVEPRERLGSLRDSWRWKRENIDHWLRQGEEDAQDWIQKTFPF